MLMPTISCATLKESIARHTAKGWCHILYSYLSIHVDISVHPKHREKEEL